MLKPALQLRLGQQLTMTPQLQQAIRLLQLPVLELQAQIREALESNVMLESEDEAGSLETAEVMDWRWHTVRDCRLRIWSSCSSTQRG
jgi:RNA polymerase sigma-54 factor